MEVLIFICIVFVVLLGLLFWFEFQYNKQLREDLAASRDELEQLTKELRDARNDASNLEAMNLLRDQIAKVTTEVVLGNKQILEAEGHLKAVQQENMRFFNQMVEMQTNYEERLKAKDEEIRHLTQKCDGLKKRLEEANATIKKQRESFNKKVKSVEAQLEKAKSANAGLLRTIEELQQNLNSLKN